MPRNPGTVLRATALAALVALAGGCQTSADDAVAPQGTPTADPGATATATPDTAVTSTTSPLAVTAANTDQVCRAVDKLIIDGSRKIAADSAAATDRDLTPEQLNAQLKENLASLADDVRGQAARAQDPAIRALVADAAKRLDAGAAAASPTKWMSTTFVGIPQKLAQECRA